MSKNKIEEIDVSNLLPTNDYLFKRLFGRKGSEKLTEYLIQNFVGIEDAQVEEVIEDEILEKDLYSEKLGILDVQARTKNNEYINIEMQCGNYEYIKNRLIFYLCKSFGMETIRAGEKYDSVRKTVAVLICKDELSILKEIPKWKTTWHIREDEYAKKVLTDRLEVVIIELEKITKMIYNGTIKPDSKIAVWSKFFLNPKALGGKELGENKDIKEVKEKYDELLTDYEAAKLALSRQMYVMDINSSKSEGYREGIERGRQAGYREGIEDGKQEGYREGIEEGKKSGFQDGIDEGRKAEKIEMTQKMFRNGKSIEEIMEITELSREEIEDIKKTIFD